MALKEKPVTITHEGRDKGKSFLITEMPLLKADRWACRFGLGMIRGGLNADGLGGADVNRVNLKTIDGMLELAKIGVGALGNIDEELALELIDELTRSCVKIIPANGTPRAVVWGDDENNGDIEEISTIMFLRKEALGIHINFLAQGDQSS